MPWVSVRQPGDATGKIRGRTWDEVKEPYADYLIGYLTGTYAPTLNDNILKRVVHSPVDIERLMVSAVHGTVTHGAILPYQIGRSVRCRNLRDTARRSQTSISAVQAVIPAPASQWRREEMPRRSCCQICRPTSETWAANQDRAEKLMDPR